MAVFKRLAAAGAGRPVDKDGFVEGPWTPDLLATEIAKIEKNKSGVELRTVQTWFLDNDRAISTETFGGSLELLDAMTLTRQVTGKQR